MRLGSFLSSSATIASFSHLSRLLLFFCLCSLLQPGIHPFFCPITVIHHSLSSSSHYYPVPPPPVSFSSARDLSSPLQLFSSWLLSPSFYLSVKHNLSSHSFIVTILRSSPDISVLVHMPSESDITWLDVYRLSAGITALLMFLLGVINASVPGSLGQYLLNYSGSDIAI